MIRALVQHGRIEVQEPIPAEWEGQLVKILPLTPMTRYRILKSVSPPCTRLARWNSILANVRKSTRNCGKWIA